MNTPRYQLRPSFETEDEDLASPVSNQDKKERIVEVSAGVEQGGKRSWDFACGLVIPRLLREFMLVVPN